MDNLFWATVPPLVEVRRGKTTDGRDHRLSSDPLLVLAYLRSGRHLPEWPDGIVRNQWTACSGMGGRHGPESAHAYYAHFLSIMGRSAEGISHSERALELDPFNPLFQGLYAVVLCFERRWEEAMTAAQTAMDMQPLMNVARTAMQYAYIATGMRDEQLALQRARIAADPERLAAFEQGLAEGGYIGAQRAIAQVLANRFSEGRYFAARGVALRYLDAGDYQEALDWLEIAFEGREQTLPYISGVPIWDPLRSDPRFQALLRKMNLPEEVIVAGQNGHG